MNRTGTEATRVRRFLGLFAFLVLWASSPSLGAQTKDTATLTIRVTGVRNTKGKIGVILFQDAQGFPDDRSKAIRQQSAEIDRQPKLLCRGAAVRNYLEVGRFCRYLPMPSRRIFDSSVWRGIPSFAAAPEGPDIRP
jgi:hypothetical protein